MILSLFYKKLNIQLCAKNICIEQQRHNFALWHILKKNSNIIINFTPNNIYNQNITILQEIIKAIGEDPSKFKDKQEIITFLQNCNL